MSTQGSRFIRSIVIEQQARELRARYVRAAAVRGWAFFKEAAQLFSESVALSRAARADGFGAQ
jgi:hypothetical protein